MNNRGVEAQVNHVEMPAGNKDFMRLVANGAGGAKEQHGHATGAKTPRTPGIANHIHRSEQSDEEKLYGTGNATDVCAFPYYFNISESSLECHRRRSKI